MPAKRYVRCKICAKEHEVELMLEQDGQLIYEYRCPINNELCRVSDGVYSKNI